MVSRVVFEGATVWPAAMAATTAADTRRESDKAMICCGIAEAGREGDRKERTWRRRSLEESRLTYPSVRGGAGGLIEGEKGCRGEGQRGNSGTIR